MKTTYRISYVTGEIAVRIDDITHERVDIINRRIEDQIIENAYNPVYAFDDAEEAKAALADLQPEIITWREVESAPRSGVNRLLRADAYILEAIEPDEDEDPLDPYYCGSVDTLEIRFARVCPPSAELPRPPFRCTDSTGF